MFRYEQALPSDSANCFVTDPPYYNAVPYADLRISFMFGLRRSLQGIHKDLFAACSRSEG